MPPYIAVVVVVLSLADGGFFPWTWPWATLALAATAVGVPLLLGVERFAPLEVAFVVALAALSAWQAVSSSWSPDPERSLEDALRGTVYVAAAAALLVLARAAGSRAVLIGVLGGVAATLAYGLVEHARSDVVDPIEGSLLYQPVGYANSIGILAAIGIVVAVGLFTEARATAVRAALLCVVGLSVAALVLSESRGAVAAGAVGLAIAGVCLWRRRALPGALGLVGLLVVAILVSPLVVDPARLHGLLTDRAYYWPVAWHALDAPFRGLGSGAFAQLWALEQPIPRTAIDAHSLFLEALLELGVVGLVIVLVTIALPLIVAPRLTGGWAAGATGAYTAFLVHAAVDWDWEMPVVTIAGLACGAALLAAAGHRRAPRTAGGSSI